MYISCHHRVQALDELDMCTMRLRFPFECEEDIESKPYVVKKHEVCYFLLLTFAWYTPFDLKYNCQLGCFIEVVLPTWLLHLKGVVSSCLMLRGCLLNDIYMGAGLNRKE